MLLLAAMAASLALAIALVVLWIDLPTGPPPAISMVPATSSGGALSKEIRFARLTKPKPLSELHFVNGDGKTMTFADFRGRVVLLNLWATWCVPCRKEMPALDRLQAKLGGPEFQVVPLSIDRGGLPAIKAFYRKLGLKSLGIYNDPSGNATSELGAIGIPTTLLVDRKGREIGRKVGPAEWDSPQAIAVIHRTLVEPPPGTGEPAAKPVPAN
ncbi:MAG TPA: TlpA disulfide reductase family protein [Stellaceae bacterium]|nr:TlpA disulfide reductase family protein [Stellaceae bacterium]